jgi:hypothetical protein
MLALRAGSRISKALVQIYQTHCDARPCDETTDELTMVGGPSRAMERQLSLIHYVVIEVVHPDPYGCLIIPKRTDLPNVESRMLIVNSELR